MRFTITNTIAVLVTVFTVGCAQAPDFSGVTAEKAKPIQRYDNFQAAASNGRRLVSAGGGGVLVTSTDGGHQWERRVLESPSSVISMSSCPDGTFAALDFYRKVWIGDASAENWTAQKLDSDINPIAMTCDASNKLWVVGSYSTVLSSADKGKTWTSATIGEDSILTAVQFLDASHGVVSGEFGTFQTTSDGGATWQKQAGLPPEFYPYAMAFADTQRGWLSGLGGVLMQTRDGGKTWQPQNNPTGAPMYALLFVGRDLYAVGDGGLVLGLRGDEWSPVVDKAKSTAYLTAGAPLEAQALLVAGAAGALRVIDLQSSAVAVAALASERGEK